ncbi:DUF433 domain-containing protein [Sorangium sp. So ce385]|uniref:DUF433 domain-containing protein n=1 Tax=Sorangium sp. So ce385 TaxID=3133308 RepID=UPI003F5C5D5B
MTVTLKEIQHELALFSDAEKAQLARALFPGLPGLTRGVAGVEKRPGVCGGDACIVCTRIPVWALERRRRLGHVTPQQQSVRAMCGETA